MSSATPPTSTSADGRQEPTFWQQYSPRGECPMSVAGSAVLHLAPFVMIGAFAYFGLSCGGFFGSTDAAKPPELDVVELAGGGGRLDGIADSSGQGGAGATRKRESAGADKPGNPRTGDFEIKDIKLDKVAKTDFKIGETSDSIDDDGSVFAKLDREQTIGKKILENDGGTGPAGGKVVGTIGGPAAKGTGGGTGGGNGSGDGKLNGPGKGTNPKGAVFTDQRRRELRWQILASPNGDVHLKKLQALQVLLLVPLQTKPGFMMRFDLSKPSLVGELVRAEDDSKKVRWKNANAGEMVTLAKVLNLPEVPRFTVIYLPSGLEADMARKELAYQGRLESEILKTVWDVRERDGAYENEPYIVEQFLRPGVR